MPVALSRATVQRSLSEVPPTEPTVLSANVFASQTAPVHTRTSALSSAAHGAPLGSIHSAVAEPESSPDGASVHAEPFQWNWLGTPARTPATHTSSNARAATACQRAATGGVRTVQVS